MKVRLVAVSLFLLFIFALVPLAVKAQGPEGIPPENVIRAEPVRGVTIGPGIKLWVFVFPERGKGKPPQGEPPAYCTDEDQFTTVPRFANANSAGLTFNINDGSIPIDTTNAIGAIQDSFAAWDNVNITSPYFTVVNTGGASGPALDGNNAVGWAYIVPRFVLAAAWVWTDDNNSVIQADIFYNHFHKWEVFTACNAESKYEVGDVGTHEVGHVVGLDHLSDPNAYATMYPSAAKGEVRKRTLTAGDATGYLAAGGY